MSEYTPTTGNVRSVFAYAGAGQSERRRREAFDRWLAAHDAEVAARTLREAADAHLSEYGTWGGASQGAWLRARADQIEIETKEQGS